MAKRIVLCVIITSTAFSMAWVGAVLLSGTSGFSGIHLIIETISGRSGTFIGDSSRATLNNIGIVAPLTFAFGAGIAAAFNPCGFAMLPAYLGLYIGSDHEFKSKKSIVTNLIRAVFVGIVVTAGFISLFSLTGILIAFGARSLLTNVLPWFGLSVGLLLIIGGSWLLSGGSLYASLASQVAARIGNPNQLSAKSYFLFGLSYGVASLSCTLPIFLAVVGTSFTTQNLSASFNQFLAYGLGMGFVIMTLTIGATLFKRALSQMKMRVFRYIEPLGIALMIGAGIYIVFYWLTVGNILDYRNL